MLAFAVTVKLSFHNLDNPVARTAMETELLSSINSDISVSVSFNHEPSQALPSSDYRVLILWEPSSVMPWQYNKKNLEKFNLVIPMSPWRAKQLGYRKFSFHPYTAPTRFISPWVDRENKIVMINAAKFSAGAKSNYGLRRAVSKALYSSRVNYNLYGFDWRMSPYMEIVRRLAALKNSLTAKEKINLKELTSELFYKYPEYMGNVDDKIALLGSVEMSLVIENESDWITEKLFDSICAGAVPVYVGPDLGSEFKELERCLIRVEDNAEAIRSVVENVSKDTLSAKKRAIAEFLELTDERGLAFWKPETLWRRVANIIKEELTLYVNRESR